MRTVPLLCLLALAGCAEPPAPVVEEPITVAVAEPPLDPPMSEEQRETFINCSDQLLRALARREIDLGMHIEPVIARFPNLEVTRHGPYTTLEDGPVANHSVVLIAKNGKLIVGRISGCFPLVFFDERTRGEYDLWANSYYPAWQAQHGLVAPMPRAKP